MKYTEFLGMIIDGGIDAARRDYAHDVFKRDGSIAGFEACRGKHPGDLAVLLAEAHEATKKASSDRNLRAMGSGIGEYWRVRCFELEVEWVANCVAAAFELVDLRRRVEVPAPFVEWKNPPVPFTARGALRAAAVLGASAH